LLGAVGGMATITRPPLLVCVVACSVWLLIRHWRRRAGVTAIWQTIAGLAVGFTVVTLPVALACQEVTGSFRVLPAGGGLNLYIGNNPDATQTEAARPWAEFERLRSLPAREGSYDLYARQAHFHDRIFTYLRTDPVGFLRGLLRKAGQFISARELTGILDVYLYRTWSTVHRLLTWRIGAFGFPFGVLLPLSVIGMIGCRKRLGAPLLLCLVFFAALTILVRYEARYRIPLVPLLAIGAAAGVSWLAAQVRKARWSALV
jgi:hypothetical protein